MEVHTAVAEAARRASSKFQALSCRSTSDAAGGGGWSAASTDCEACTRLPGAANSRWSESSAHTRKAGRRGGRRLGAGAPRPPVLGPGGRTRSNMATERQGCVFDLAEIAVSGACTRGPRRRGYKLV